MNNVTKISIVTPSFDSAKTISDALVSIDDQEFENWSHFVIDGGSSDETCEIVERFSDSRRTFLSEADNGIYDAMCKGISLSDGDIIGFLNSDDFFEGSGVLSLIADLFAKTDVEIVYGNLKYVDQQDTSKVIRNWKSEPFRKGMFFRGWMPPHPTVYARREVFEKVGLFDQNYDICADWEWLFRAFELHEVKSRFLDEYLVRMRLGGVSNGSLGNVLRSNRQAMRAFRKHGKGFPLGFFPGKFAHRLRQFV